MKIKAAILSMIKEHLVPTVYIGKVVSVDQTSLSCEVDLQTMPNVFDVRIRATIGSGDRGLINIPKVDSYVLICRIEGKIESSFVLGYTEIEVMKLLPESDLHLFGDSHGGLVISSKVNDEINSLKTELNTLKSALASWVPVPQDGGTALKASITSFASGQLSPSQSTDFENEKVKHGN